MSALRVVVLCCDGVFQRHLLWRAGEEFELAGFVLQQSNQAKQGLAKRFARYRKPTALLRQLAARLLLPRYEARAVPLIAQLFHRDGQAPQLPPSTPQLAVENINNPEVAEFIRGLAPDIVLVNGTQLLREPLLALIGQIRLGIINLHTGLSPYSRGGNCNLFMLMEGHPELVGVTVHHIDAGIDSGDIIATAQVPMHADDTFEMIDARSFHLGIDLLLQAATQLQSGQAPRVKQWQEGKLFLRRTGYVYEPYHRLRVNRMLAQGLVSRYLRERATRDRDVRLIGAPS